MKSDHVRFDAYSVLRVLLNFRVICGFRYYTEFLLGFPRKEVLGWQLQLETTTESKRIVFFGSLCRQSSHALLQSAGCEFLVLPLAGRVRCQSRVQTGALLWGHILSPTTVEEMRAGIIPPVVSMYAVNPAHFDPEMAPKGKQMLAIGTWCRPDPKAKEIKALQKTVDEQFEEMFPREAKYIEAKEATLGRPKYRRSAGTPSCRGWEGRQLAWP